MPAVPSFLIEPLGEQSQALISVRFDAYPPGCDRRRIPDRIIFDKLVQVLVLVLGAAYAKISDSSCSATTLRHRRDEWITAGIFSRLEQICLDAYHRMIGLDLGDVAVDGCSVKAPCGGEAAARSTVDRGKQGTKRSLLVDGHGITPGTVVASANRHELSLLRPTLEKLNRFAELPEKITVHWTSSAATARSPRRASPHRCKRPAAGRSSAPTPGTTAASENSRSALKCEPGSSTRSSPPPTPSSDA